MLQPHGQGVNISRRISSDAERNRLRALGVLIKPPGAGLLIRTEADGISEELLIEDLESLLRQWEAIQQAAETAAPPVLLNRDEDFIHRILRDHMGPDLARVVVDDAAAVNRVSSFLGAEAGNVLVEAHSEPSELLEHYKVNAAIRDALKPRVDLPSGGYVIIEPTEALTVIDVNSGSFTRSANARETVLWTNCEAAIEIARQLKLRNIGGVIIIDFIDMDSRRDQLQLLEHFTTAVRDDSARPQIAQLTNWAWWNSPASVKGRTSMNCSVGLAPAVVVWAMWPFSPAKTCFNLWRRPRDWCVRRPLPAPKLLRQERAVAMAGGGAVVEGAAVRMPSFLSRRFDTTAPEVSTQEAQEPATARRQDPELVAVPMTDEQQQLFGWLGLNPALDGGAACIRQRVGPGCASWRGRAGGAGGGASAIGGQFVRRRRRGGRGGRSGSRNGASQPTATPAAETPVVVRPSATDESAPLMVEITPLGGGDQPDDHRTRTVPPSANRLSPSVAVAETAEPDEPRRRRRRSSAVATV